MKVVINTCFGGFGLSYEGVMYYAKLKGIEVYANHEVHDDGSSSTAYDKRPIEPGPSKELFGMHYATKPDLKVIDDLNDCYYNPSDIKRDDPFLVRTVEELGDKANGQFASLEVVEIPDGIQWEIEEYDGSEHIAESHRTWG